MLFHSTQLYSNRVRMETNESDKQKAHQTFISIMHCRKGRLLHAWEKISLSVVFYLYLSLAPNRMLKYYDKPEKN